MKCKKPIAARWSSWVAAACLAFGLAGCGGSIANTTPPPVIQSANFAFVSNINSNTVSAFHVDPISGKLFPAIGSPFPTDTGPEFLAASAGGKFLFVGNSRSRTISAFQIDAVSGALVPVLGSPFVTGNRPEGVTVDPMGRFLFVGNQASSSISVFSISSNGALTPVPGSPFPANSPFQLVTNPSGTILFVNNFPDSTVSDLNTVSAFQISSNGTLIPVPGSPFPTTNSSGFRVRGGIGGRSRWQVLVCG